MKSLTFIIGASGAGKSTALDAYSKNNPEAIVINGDSWGVPSPEIMERDFGGGQGWQKMRTLELIEHAASNGECNDREVVIDFGANPHFIKEGLEKFKISSEKACVLLFDCEDAVRAERLGVRGDEYLENEDMRNWAAYLRREVAALGFGIIDTTHITKEKMGEILVKE